MRKVIIIIALLISPSLIANYSDLPAQWGSIIEFDPITDKKIIVFAVASREKGEYDYSNLVVRFVENSESDVYIIWKNYNTIFEKHKVVVRFDNETPEEFMCLFAIDGTASFIPNKEVKSFIGKLVTSKKLTVRIDFYEKTITRIFDTSGFYDEFIKHSQELDW